MSNKTGTTKTTVLYARPATDDVASLTRQLEACQEWAEANGHTVIGKFSEVAGGLARNLPLLAEAVRLAEVQGAALVCVDASRLARSMALFTLRVADCEARGVAVLYVRQGTKSHERR